MDYNWQKGSGRWGMKFHKQVPFLPGGVKNYGRQVWRVWYCKHHLEFYLGRWELVISWPAPMRMEQS